MFARNASPAGEQGLGDGHAGGLRPRPPHLVAAGGEGKEVLRGQGDHTGVRRCGTLHICDG